MRLTLSTRNARAVAANFVAANERAQRAVQKLVRKHGVALHAKVYADTPVLTGFMRSQLRLRFSEGGYSYEVGWDEADFASAGLEFYPPYVLFGTRHMPGNDVLFSNRDAQLEAFRKELGAELRKAVRQRNRTRGA